MKTNRNQGILSAVLMLVGGIIVDLAVVGGIQIKRTWPVGQADEINYLAPVMVVAQAGRTIGTESYVAGRSVIEVEETRITAK